MIDKITASLNNNLKELKSHLTAFAWEQPEAYAAWLAQSYYYVRFSTRLLIMAGAYCPVDSNEFHHRFIEHAKEEKNHEKILITDLKSLNRTPADYPEFASTAALYQTQYYWIQNGSPMAFFGYVLALEAIGANCCPYMNERVKPHYPKGNHFIRVHGEEDVDHIEKALAKIGQLPAQDMEKVLCNMERTFSYYTEMLGECMKAAGQVKHKKAS